MNKNGTKHEVLTPGEAARFLRIEKGRLLELAQRGGLPARKIDDE